MAIAIVHLLFAIFSMNAYCQKYKSNTSSVHFFSDAPMEDIEATNLDGKSAFDMSSGEIVFSISIRSFTFEKLLMQEHFNENYMESDKYPNATFTGKVTNYDPALSVRQKAVARGTMTIHGIEQDIAVEGHLKFADNSLELNASFPIRLKDYKIKIPKVVFYNIAEIVDVTVKFNYEKLN